MQSPAQLAERADILIAYIAKSALVIAMCFCYLLNNIDALKSIIDCNHFSTALSPEFTVPSEFMNNDLRC